MYLIGVVGTRSRVCLNNEGNNVFRKLCPKSSLGLEAQFKEERLTEIFFFLAKNKTTDLSLFKSSIFKSEVQKGKHLNGNLVDDSKLGLTWNYHNTSLND